MNDGGAETSTKSIMERYMQEPLRRFMGWLAKKGFIKGKNAAKSYKENHLTKAVELCKKDGSTKELIHSEYELTQDEMMKIAAKAKRDGVPLYIKDSKHPDKHYSKDEIYKMAKPYEKILNIEEELKDNPKMDVEIRKSKLTELEKLKRENTLTGQIKVLEDSKIDDIAKLNELNTKIESGKELNEAEKNEIANISDRLNKTNQKIEKLKEYNAPTFQFGCNKSRTEWKNMIIQEAIEDRIKSPKDYNGDGITNEKDEEISNGSDVKLTAEDVSKAKDGKTFGIKYTDFEKDYAVQSVSCKQFASLSESLESLNYGAVKTEGDNVDIYIPLKDFDSYKSFCPDSSPISIYMNNAKGSVDKLTKEDNAFSFVFKSRDELNDALNKFEGQDCMVIENTNGTFNLTVSYSDIQDAAHRFEQKKTKDELDQEAMKLMEETEKAADTPLKDVEQNIAKDSEGIDIADGIESK